MSHAALASDGVACLVVVLTLLLVGFVYEIARMPAEPAGAPDLPAPPPPLPVRRPPATTPPAGAAGLPGDAAVVPRQDVAQRLRVYGRAPRDPAPAEQDVIRPPKVSGGPPWEPAPRPPGLGL